MSEYLFTFAGENHSHAGVAACTPDRLIACFLYECIMRCTVFVRVGNAFDTPHKNRWDVQWWQLQAT